MNIQDIILTANSNLARSKTRTLLTVLSIFIGAFTIAMTVGITSGISSYIDEQLGNVGAENVLIVRPRVDIDIDSDSGPKKYDPNKSNNTSSSRIPLFTKEDLEKVRSQDGIESAEELYSFSPEYISYNNGEKYQITMLSYMTGTEYVTDAGNLPDNNSDKPQILLPSDYLSPLGFDSAESAVGKIIVLAVKNSVTGQITEVETEVVGVQGASLFAIAGTNGNKALMKKLNDLVTEGLPSTYKEQFPGVIAYMNKENSEEKIKEIKSKLRAENYNALTIQDQIGIVDQIIDAITNVLVFFGAIALLAASFGIINTLYMAVQERTKEIGLMKAMGMAKSRLFLLFSIEASLIGFWGSILGIIVAMAAGSVANRVASETFLKDLIGFELTVFPLPSVIAIIIIVMLIAFLAGTLPARKASNQDPIEALRYE